MKKIVECVPNFSEGRRKGVIEAIVNAIKSRKGIKVLDYSGDSDHNRMVVTFVGTPKSVKEAILKSSKKAIELIDLKRHKGEHPRIGAVDVIPFIPVLNTTMEECTKLACEVGKALAQKFELPVYLYGEATKERTRLGTIRKYGFEGLDKLMKELKPDFGDAKPHPTAGACAVGARKPLIAFNVNLDSNNLEIAKKIAKSIRASSGGLPSVQALGIELKSKGIVQVSMNLVDYEITSVVKAFEAVKAEARKYGVQVIGSEIIGLVPLNALIDIAKYYLQLEDFSSFKILEKRIWED
ncbi:MAG: glutamate formimidoyltransferase [Candidatus Thermoplasmatota archaeon]|nr:glutamate formimidoyltransferase [Candidatus Thermoplasmatota archaeon]MDI6887417.1 glutamate formimidoyltransferase [Candidatus Thermoplasmatota archaeon]